MSDAKDILTKILEGAAEAVTKKPKVLSGFEERSKKIEEALKEIGTPGWQMFRLSMIYLVLLIVFGMIYQVVISTNPEEWNIPTDGSGNTIPINGMYFASVVQSSTGFGDYSPFSHRAIVLVIINIVFAYCTMHLFLS